MKKLRFAGLLLIILTTALFTGCGGSSSPGSKNPGSPGGSINPFAGDWQGTWVIIDLNKIGREIVHIGNDGKVTGKIIYPDLATLADFSGSCDQAGAFTVSYQIPDGKPITISGTLHLSNGQLSCTTKYNAYNQDHDMIFTMKARGAIQYAGTWSGSWIATDGTGFGNFTIATDGVITGSITYPKIGVININGLSDSIGFSLSYGYGQYAYSCSGVYMEYASGHLKGTFWDDYLGGRGTFELFGTPIIPPPALSYQFVKKWGYLLFPEDPYTAISPTKISIDSADNLYVTDGMNIWKSTTDGTILNNWSPSEGPHRIRGMAPDSASNLYILYDNTDFVNPVFQIQKYDSNGVLLNYWGSKGSGDEQLQNPGSITIGKSGNNEYIYVMDNCQIKKYDTEGNFILKWGSEGTGNGQFASMADITTDSAGNVYAIDYNAIQKFDSQGNFTDRWQRQNYADMRFDSMVAIAIDTTGNIFVLNNMYEKEAFLGFGPNGNLLTYFEGSGSDDGQFNFPSGIVVDSLGNIYIADTYNSRVQKFAPTH
ncbi:MAG TPA: hypothetical protein VHY08_27170 [Bacillota bacterium]|nr:hypothetical protein [Bacillota bacterium]